MDILRNVQIQIYNILLLLLFFLYGHNGHGLWVRLLFIASNKSFTVKGGGKGRFLHFGRFFC